MEKVIVVVVTSFLCSVFNAEVAGEGTCKEKNEISKSPGRELQLSSQRAQHLSNPDSNVGPVFVDL